MDIKPGDIVHRDGFKRDYEVTRVSGDRYWVQTFAGESYSSYPFEGTTVVRRPTVACKIKELEAEIKALKESQIVVGQTYNDTEVLAIFDKYVWIKTKHQPPQTMTKDTFLDRYVYPRNC